MKKGCSTYVELHINPLQSICSIGFLFLLQLKCYYRSFVSERLLVLYRFFTSNCVAIFYLLCFRAEYICSLDGTRILVPVHTSKMRLISGRYACYISIPLQNILTSETITTAAYMWTNILVLLLKVSIESGS